MRLLEEKILELSSTLTKLSADNQELRRDITRLQEVETRVGLQFRGQEQIERQDQQLVSNKDQTQGQDQIYGEDPSQGQGRARRNRGLRVQVRLMKLVNRARGLLGGWKWGV